MMRQSRRELFLNLPVTDLRRAKEFFARLGFEFDPHFTDERAACMIVSDHAYVMLITQGFFTTFTKRPLADTRAVTEGIFAYSCASRAEVDRTVNQALAAGGRRALDPVDHGFMYSASFYDLDGHQWEVLWMDPATVGGAAA